MVSKDFSKPNELRSKAEVLGQRAEGNSLKGVACIHKVRREDDNLNLLPPGGADTWGDPKCLNAPSSCPYALALAKLYPKGLLYPKGQRYPLGLPSEAEASVIATANSSTISNTGAEVLKILNNSDLLTMLGILVFLLVVSLFLGKKKNQITSGRFANNGDKLQATKKAIKQIETVKQGKCQPCALWSGTPNYWFPGKLKRIGASWQTMLGASPTVWFPHAERGILVKKSPINQKGK